MRGQKESLEDTALDVFAPAPDGAPKYGSRAVQARQTAHEAPDEPGQSIRRASSGANGALGRGQQKIGAVRHQQNTDHALEQPNVHDPEQQNPERHAEYPSG